MAKVKSIQELREMLAQQKLDKWSFYATLREKIAAGSCTTENLNYHELCQLVAGGTLTVV